MTTSFIEQLPQIYGRIDERVRSILAEQPDWPCRQGCAACCNALGQLLEITEAEWRYLREGIALLDPTTRAAVRDGIEQAAPSPEGLYSCPLLDSASGACRVYAHRPAACRMFGFYVSRIGNRWCEILQDDFERGRMSEIVLGNQDAIEQELRRRFGPARSISTWSAYR